MTRKAKTKKKAEAKPKQKTATRQHAADENTFREEGEYGGLPDRDLKKNLGGCG